jgi:hypothetical protein
MKSQVRGLKSEVSLGALSLQGRRIRGLICSTTGLGCLWLCLNGFDRLLHLMEDEGTESWTVKAGPLGIAGCGIFLAILFLASVSLIICAIHSFVESNPTYSCRNRK